MARFKARSSNWISSELRTIVLAAVRAVLSFCVLLISNCIALVNATRRLFCIITMKVTRSSIRRKSITTIGLPIADLLCKIEFRKSNLEGPKQIFLPKCGVNMNYYERKAVSESGRITAEQLNQATIILFHGFSSSAKEFFSFLGLLDIPDHIRVLVPEQMGHGEDLKRAFTEGDTFQQPDADIMVDSTDEFLDVMKVGNNCNAFGTSFGGVLLYYLRLKRPDIIQKTVLVSPALASCLADSFLDGLIDGSHNFVDFQNRDDVVHLFRNFLWIGPDRRKSISKKDPFPAFIYNFLYELNLRDVPRGHNKGLQDSLIRAVTHPKGSISGDNEDTYLVTTDIDKNSPRLVVWPEEDQICDHNKGRRFFESSVASGSTVFESIPECGHVFHANGKGIYEFLAPKVQDFLLDFSS